MLSIIGLTITIRTLLIPLFVKQIKSSRNMQLLQPQIKELQQKYGHDRERLTQEQMKLWQETGTNPFASCLPLILQMPIFFALFRVIDQAPSMARQDAKGFLTAEQAESLPNAEAPGRAHRRHRSSSDHTHDQDVIAMSLVVAHVRDQFLTQRQLMSKNMPADAMTGPYAQQQKLLLYVLPVVFAVGGVAFPLGVLFYWTTSNLWTMGQQFYVIRNNPAPGTPAFKAKQERDRRSGKTSQEDPLTQVDREPSDAPRVSSPRTRRASSARRGSSPRQVDVRLRPSAPRDPDSGRRGRQQKPRRHRHERPRQPTEDSAIDRTAAAKTPKRVDAMTTPGSSRTRATSPPTSSRSCSTSPISTVTSTWTSTATAPRSRSSVAISTTWWVATARCSTPCRS